MATKLRRGLSMSLVPILGVFNIFCLGRAQEQVLENPMEVYKERQLCKRDFVRFDGTTEPGALRAKILSWMGTPFPFSDDETEKKRRGYVTIARLLHKFAANEKKPFDFNEVKDLAEKWKRRPQCPPVAETSSKDDLKVEFGNIISDWLIFPLSELDMQMKEMNTAKENEKPKKRRKRWHRGVFKKVLKRTKKLFFEGPFPDYEAIKLQTRPPSGYMDDDALQKFAKIAQLAVFTMLLAVDDAIRAARPVIYGEGYTCDTIGQCVCVVRFEQDLKPVIQDYHKLLFMIRTRDTLEAVAKVQRHQTFDKKEHTHEELKKSYEAKKKMHADRSIFDVTYKRLLANDGNYYKMLARELEHINQRKEVEKEKEIANNYWLALLDGLVLQVDSKLASSEAYNTRV